MQEFVKLRNQLGELREATANGDLTPAQRDLVAVAQAEALCDLAATMNGVISVSTE